MNSFLYIVFIFIALLAIVFVLVESLAKPSLRHIFFGVIAVIFGLMIGTLLTDPLSKLPGVWGTYLPLTVSVVFAIGGLFLYRKFSFLVDEWGDNLVSVYKHFFATTATAGGQVVQCGEVLIDSSVLIDMRIVEIVKSGFLPQKVVIPRFIVRELQNIADSKDNDRREKGKRGLAAVEQLHKLKGKGYELATEAMEDTVEVDHKLIALAQKRHADLVTTDYNLNKLAGAEGVRVLNINELAQGLRPTLLPGEFFNVKIVHLGKDKTQGVGYLEDGTMIVVENAGRLVGKSTDVQISRSLQTAAGKMYFAKVQNTPSLRGTKQSS